MDIIRKVFTISLFSLITVTFSSGKYRNEPDSTGLPGDNFSLEAALDLFKNSNSLEDFEEKINNQENYVNNLDLNEDGEIDYIRVNDYIEGNTHAIVLQTSVNETESQDIAVIEVEKQSAQSAVIQIVGDEDLYGQQKIIEPSQQLPASNRTPAESANNGKVVVNVIAWPSVGFIFAPGYTSYRSGWRWRHYPAYWKPWKPFHFRTYYYHPRLYRANYHMVNVRRVVYAPRIYMPHRRTSVIVKNRYHVTKVKKVNKSQHLHVNKSKHVQVKRNNYRKAGSRKQESKTRDRGRAKTLGHRNKR